MQELRVLIAEPDPRNQGVLISFLREPLGDTTAQWITAENPTHTRMAVETQKFHGAMVRWDDPAFDGKQCLEIIRNSSSNSGIPVVRLVDNKKAAALNYIVAHQLGARSHLCSPYIAHDIERVLAPMIESMNSERKRYQRVPLGSPIRCAWGQQWTAGTCLDISSSGTLLEFERPPSVGTWMQLEVSFPSSPTSLALKGLVVRQPNQNQIGVQFVDMPRPIREQLTMQVEAAFAAA